jgi:hypothetical protein
VEPEGLVRCSQCSLVPILSQMNPVQTHPISLRSVLIRRCIQKFPDWPPGVRIANGTALCHQVQLYRYFVSQSSEFCRHNTLCCFSTSVYCCCLFRYLLSPEIFGYALVLSSHLRLGLPSGLFAPFQLFRSLDQ